jgi:DNA repair exonuclease SbcCD ATPase subunit
VTEAADANGNFHGEDGRFVSLRSYVERIFDEKDRAAEFARATLERALIEAKVTTERAMQEAKVTTDTRLAEAKAAADAVTTTVQKRIELLESGGAPFASRLDEGLTQLKADVDTLKENMVRTTVLDALREQTIQEAKTQKSQIRNIAIAAGLSFAISLVLIGLQLLR